MLLCVFHAKQQRIYEFKASRSRKWHTFFSLFHSALQVSHPVPRRGVVEASTHLASDLTRPFRRCLRHHWRSTFRRIRGRLRERNRQSRVDRDHHAKSGAAVQFESRYKPGGLSQERELKARVNILRRHSRQGKAPRQRPSQQDRTTSAKRKFSTPKKSSLHRSRGSSRFR